MGLYNCYDPKQWHDIMRITLARAAPVCMAYDCRLATFGFPFAQARARGSTRTEALVTPADVAAFVAGSTSIGEGGESFKGLADLGRFAQFPFPGPEGLPRALGRPVATTPRPQGSKAVTPLEVAAELQAGRDQLLVLGLGPRGLPAGFLDAAPAHLEVTGKGVSMETATALGAIPASIRAHLHHLDPAPVRNREAP